MASAYVCDRCQSISPGFSANISIEPTKPQSRWIRGPIPTDLTSMGLDLCPDCAESLRIWYHEGAPEIPTK